MKDIDKKIDEFLSEERLDEGIWTSLVDDMKRVMTNKVTGKEQIRRVANSFFNVWRTVLLVIKADGAKGVKIDPLIDKLIKEMGQARKIIRNVIE